LLVALYCRPATVGHRNGELELASFGWNAAQNSILRKHNAGGQSTLRNFPAQRCDSPMRFQTSLVVLSEICFVQIRGLNNQRFASRRALLRPSDADKQATE